MNTSRKRDDLLVERRDIRSTVALDLIAALNAELTRRYPEDGATHFRLDPDEVTEGHGAFLIVSRAGVPVGCGAVRRIDDGRAEIKRMYVAPGERSRGVGRTLLAALEAEARALGLVELVLETGVRQPEAIALYERAGFSRIPPFGEYVGSPLSVCMAKPIETSRSTRETPAGGMPIDRAGQSARPEFDVHLVENVLVRMRDGVRLATDVYRPARGGRPLAEPRPVLLHRTPYNKTEAEATLGQCRWFATRGYVVVNQDCRGCFRSEGEVNFLIPEAEDGADTIAWIRGQEWSNGIVGSFGTSWSGWTQTAMAALGPEGLRTMIPNMSGADAHESSVRHGGALELRFLAWAFWHSAYNTQAALTAPSFVVPGLNFGAPPFSDWLERMPIRAGQTQLALVPPYERWALEILTRADYDDYWRHPSLNPRAHWDRFADMPILFVGGWYDSYARATFQNFTGLRASGRPVRALVGPWTHGAKTVEVSYAGDVEFGREAALPSFDELHLRWFDRWLRGVDNGLDREAPLRIFVMGGGSGRRSGAGRLVHGGRWRDEYEWPLARTRFTDFYLHADGSLRADPPREADSATSYRFDPAHPVPSIGGNVSSLRDVLPLPAGIVDPSYAGRGERTADVMRPGGFDQREAPGFHGCRPPYLTLGSRPDVLVFQTEPLEEPVEVTGPIEVRLWVATSAPDTDFTAKLIDVYPPSPWYPLGYALNLTDSIVRLRYRNGRERAEFAAPGVAVPLTITLYPTSNLFMPGHRIRLDISSSNHPRFDVNPNTGEPIGRERRRIVADNTVFHERARESRLILPLVPLDSSRS